MMPDPLPDAAALLGLEIPDECRPGVNANLKALAEHIRILETPTTP
ncbi:MAG: AtzG-like protein [Pseudomonadota bacterium]